MTTYGLTPQGFVVKPLEDIKTDLEAALRARFGQSINLAPQSAFAQLGGILADRMAEIWDLGEGIYEAFTTDGAAGTQLDLLAGLTGAQRLPPTKSKASLIAAGALNTVVPAGRVVAVEGTGAKFAIVADITLTQSFAWIPSVLVATGLVRTNAGNVYEVITQGVTAGAGGPTGTGADIVDGTAHWRWIGTGNAWNYVDCEAEEYGPVVAAAGTLRVIATPVAGWGGVLNRLDAELGRGLESDADFRLRRERLLRSEGGSALDAVRADVLAVDGVTAAHVFENPLAVESEGMPPHSFEVLVQGGDDSDPIAQAIWDSKPVGICPIGDDAGLARDSEGQSLYVSFSRPQELLVYVDVSVSVDPRTFPADGVAQIEQALVDFGTRKLIIGADVVASAVSAQAFKVSGVEDVSDVRLGLAPNPVSGATLPVTPRQIAKLDTGRIRVFVTEL